LFLQRASANMMKLLLAITLEWLKDIYKCSFI
jgi:hypothetical protein